MLGLKIIHVSERASTQVFKKVVLLQPTAWRLSSDKPLPEQVTTQMFNAYMYAKVHDSKFIFKIQIVRQPHHYFSRDLASLACSSEVVWHR